MDKSETSNLNHGTLTLKFTPKKLSTSVDLPDGPGKLGPEEEVVLQFKQDEVDALRKDPVCKWFDIVFLVVSIATYLGDLATDGFVAAKYYLDRDYWYFGLTLGFVIFPALVMSVLSANWYIKDRHNQLLEEVSTARWVARILCMFFFLSPVIRYAESLHYGLQSRKSKQRQNRLKAAQFYSQMAHEDADASFLRLFESYMEAAPQLVLQLYIMAKNAEPHHSEQESILVLLQTASVITSVVSLAWSLTSFNRSLRYAQNDKRNIDLGASIVLFFSHLFSIIARVLPLSLFASVYTWFIWPVCGFHWIFMSIWLILQKTTACTTRTEEIVFDFLIAIVHLFTFFNVKTGSTKVRCIFYYTVCFIENSLLMGFWFYGVVFNEEHLWFYYPALVGQVASFIAGVLLFVIYHKYYHPNIHPRVEVCTKDAVCASGDNPAGLNGEHPTRLGRFDVVRESQEPPL